MFTFQFLKNKIDKNTNVAKLPSAKITFFGIIVHFDLQILKMVHLVCLSFWDISSDPGFRISISVQKMWPFIESYWSKLKSLIRILKSPKHQTNKKRAKLFQSVTKTFHEKIKKYLTKKKANRQVKDKKSSEKDRFVIINSISEYTLLLVQLQLYKSSKIIEATGLTF